MLKRLFLISALVWSQLLFGQLDLNQNHSAQTFNVTNSAATTITCPLDRANFVQIYIRESSTEQIFTLTLPNGTTVEIPSGATYEIGPLRLELAAGQTVGTVTTATGAAVLQLVAQRIQ